MMDKSRAFLRTLGLPGGDLHALPTSEATFPGGAQFGVEIPTVNTFAAAKALLRETARELLGRYLFAAVSAALVFFCTPFELVVRQTLCIVCFAPLSSLAPIYTDRCHGDTALASFTNSVSIAVRLVIMLALGLGFVL